MSLYCFQEFCKTFLTCASRIYIFSWTYTCCQYDFCMKKRPIKSLNNLLHQLLLAYKVHITNLMHKVAKNMEATGGEELGPLEVHIKQVKTSLVAPNSRCAPRVTPRHHHLPSLVPLGIVRRAGVSPSSFDELRGRKLAYARIKKTRPNTRHKMRLAVI